MTVATPSAQHLLPFPLWKGDMPAVVCSWFHRAHSLKSPERNRVGIDPVEEALIGRIDRPGAAGREKAPAKLAALGRAGA